MTSIFPVRYAQPSPSALKKELLNRYVFDKITECTLFKSGLNDVYQVKSGDEIFYLRISPANKYILKDIEEEADIINILVENGVNAAPPVCCKSGKFVWEINAPEGKRFLILFKEAKNSPSGEEPKMHYNLGHMLAQIHIITDNYIITINRKGFEPDNLQTKPLELVKPYINEEDFDFLVTASQKCIDFIGDSIPATEPYYGFCHGDIQPNNYHFIGERPGLFDFDCMGIGWRAFDIAVFLWNMSMIYNDCVCLAKP